MVAGKLQKQSAEYGHSGQHGRALGLYLREKEGLVMNSNQQNMLKSYLRKTKTPPITDKKRYCMFEEKEGDSVFGYRRIASHQICSTLIVQSVVNLLTKQKNSKK